MTHPLLAIDTSTLVASVAIVRGECVLSERAEQVREGHGQSLMPLVQAVCVEAGVPSSTLAAIAAGIGPGTFTGLRVGLATAKGIALAHALPLIGISSLAAMARHAWTSALARMHPELLAVPMFDARRGEIYTAAYDRAGTAILPEQAVPAVGFAEQLSQLQRPCLCFGEGFAQYRDVIVGVLGAQCVIGEAAMQHPRAALVAELALARLARGDVDDLHQLMPRYVRGTYAV